MAFCYAQYGAQREAGIPVAVIAERIIISDIVGCESWASTTERPV
jgi:hypothetical protein